MRLPGKAAIPRLEAILASQLRGRPLLEWTERVTLEVLRKAGQSAPPIEVSEQLLKSRKVESVEFVRSLPERARLEVRGDRFGVQIDSRFSGNMRWRRLLLAHELSHTLFYEIDSGPITSQLRLRPGDPAMEWLCSYLAKCLLMPFGALKEMWHSEMSGKLSTDFSALFRLSQRCVLPWSVVAERLVEDTGLWSTILLYWQLERNGEDPSWRLVWHVAPVEGPRNLFIPVGRRQPSGEMHYPRAKGDLSKLLHQLANSEGAGKRPILSISDLKIGNLPKIATENQHSCDRVDWVLVGPHKSGSFEWADQQRPKSILIGVSNR
jgi:hypothetical protein